MENSKPYLQFSSNTEPQWAHKVQRFIINGYKQKALSLLEKVIGSFLPLFPEDNFLNAEDYPSWLFRIDLLREWGRNAEALAWVCLECELNPSNEEAKNLKEKLLIEMHHGKKISKVSEEFNCIKSGRFDWDGVAGMRSLKAEIEQDVLLPASEKEIYERFKVGLPNGIMFYGPPGCGKTFFARKIADLLEFNWKEIKPSDLGSIYVHGSQLMIGELFESAEEDGPSLLFFDEIDAYLPSRQDLYHHYSAEVNEFLSQLNEAASKGILVIGATNYIDKVDQAVLRPGRFDKKIYIGPPDLEARRELFIEKLKGRPIEQLDYYLLAKISEGLTPAEIGLVSDNAARKAIRENSLLITLQHIIKEIENYNPLIGNEIKNKYELN